MSLTKKLGTFLTISCLLIGATSASYSQSLDPSPDPTTTSDPNPFTEPSLASPSSPSLHPTPVPTGTATPTPIPTPTSTTNREKPELSYELPEFKEGKKSFIKLKIKNGQNLNTNIIKGKVIYNQGSYYNDSLNTKEIFFEMGNSEKIEVEVFFKRPGVKIIKIVPDNPDLKTRNIKVLVKSFKATVFPVKSHSSSKLSKNPKDWYVMVNLYYRYMKHPQYYQVIYKGEIIQRFLTSTARQGHLTPTGTFTLGTKLRNPKSEKYDAYMPYWTTINAPPIGAYGNHGLEGLGYLYLLGAPASHGCVRLSRKIISYYDPKTKRYKSTAIGAAKWIYENVPVGTKITIFRSPLKQIQFEIYGNLGKSKK